MAQRLSTPINIACKPPKSGASVRAERLRRAFQEGGVCFSVFPPLLHLLHLLHFPYLLVFTALTTLLPLLHFLLHLLHFLTCSPPVSCASRCRAERLRRSPPGAVAARCLDGGPGRRVVASYESWRAAAGAAPPAPPQRPGTDRAPSSALPGAA